MTYILLKPRNQLQMDRCLRRIGFLCLVIEAASGVGHEAPPEACSKEDVAFMQIRESSADAQGPCDCNPADGDNNAEYAYPVEDPSACLCSNWNPNQSNTCNADFQPCSQHHVIPGAPWGLVFFGMSMSRQHPEVLTSNLNSVTHQTKFDFNRLQDRGNQYLCKSNDDGWLTGGGNGQSSFMLPNIDSGHMEFVHPGTTCATVAPASQVKPEVASYFPNIPRLITGASLAELVERVRWKVKFNQIRVVPTNGQFTDTQEYQLRFNPYDSSGNLVNPTMTAVYNKLVNEFKDIQVLDSSDPFHMSMIRQVSFCTASARRAFRQHNEDYTIQPWYNWAKAQNGVVLNEDLPQYKVAGAGGFYLFVTRNRPLFYFAPQKWGVRGFATKTYYVKWIQDGKAVAFANPNGGPIVEILKYIPFKKKVQTFIYEHAELIEIATALCAKFNFHRLPLTYWTWP